MPASVFLGLVALILPPLLAQQPTAPPPATTQPAGGDASRTQRRPTEAAILEELLREQERTPPPLQPVRIGVHANEPAPLQPVATVGDGSLLLEGVAVVSRPGRLEREDGVSVFVFYAGNNQGMRYALPINPGSLLELMEREAERGSFDFEVTALIKLYKGRNYLELQKVVRHVPNNNLAP